MSSHCPVLRLISSPSLHLTIGVEREKKVVELEGVVRDDSTKHQITVTHLYTENANLQGKIENLSQQVKGNAGKEAEYVKKITALESQLGIGSGQENIESQLYAEILRFQGRVGKLSEEVKNHLGKEVDYVRKIKKLELTVEGLMGRSGTVQQEQAALHDSGTRPNKSLISENAELQRKVTELREAVAGNLVKEELYKKRIKGLECDVARFKKGGEIKRLQEEIRGLNKYNTTLLNRINFIGKCGMFIFSIRLLCFIFHFLHYALILTPAPPEIIDLSSPEPVHATLPDEQLVTQSHSMLLQPVSNQTRKVLGQPSLIPSHQGSGFGMVGHVVQGVTQGQDKGVKRAGETMVGPSNKKGARLG